jgi:hypothetical protein
MAGEEERERQPRAGHLRRFGCDWEYDGESSPWELVVEEPGRSGKSSRSAKSRMPYIKGL